MTWAVLTIAAVFLQVLVAEALDWFPWLAERVLRRAARHLPRDQRERWLAEWLGESDALPGRGISKLIFALGVLVTSGATASALRERRSRAKTSASYGEFIALGWTRIADHTTDLVRRRRLEREEEFHAGSF